MRLQYFRIWFMFFKTKDGFRMKMRPSAEVLCAKNFRIQLHMWDSSKSMGINITNFVEISKFKDDGPTYALFVPDLPASHPERHIKACMIGRFQGRVEVRAVIRNTELKFAKASGEFEGGGYSGRSSGALFLVAARDLATIIESLGDNTHHAQFPNTIEFSSPNGDVPVKCTILYSSDAIVLSDEREVWIGNRCGRLMCDCANDSACPYYTPPTDVRHLEHWKAKKAKIEKKIVRRTKAQNNKEALKRIIQQANF